MVAFCPSEKSALLLETMKSHPLGSDSMIIGEVLDDTECSVVMETRFGSKRVVHNIMGEPLPRIC